MWCSFIALSPKCSQSASIFVNFKSRCHLICFLVGWSRKSVLSSSPRTKDAGQACCRNTYFIWMDHSSPVGRGTVFWRLSILVNNDFSVKFVLYISCYSQGFTLLKIMRLSAAGFSIAHKVCHRDHRKECPRLHDCEHNLIKYSSMASLDRKPFHISFFLAKSFWSAYSAATAPVQVCWFECLGFVHSIHWSFLMLLRWTPTNHLQGISAETN